ncbi:hypothetical protein K378_00133 [Streptomyces sp. Amel2xB2]|uniref:hypothetical protein n=1 Tax=Streptomyces sp. Amel2xB2 TaxID=1305829 RepID=UPI000DC03B83|nr:hypothetical protein [Streptomyces sp. Amel2xB2]RAJ71315.1 hypothetical protein K378_00133 [Streptomyces sp. Amel2xB2]
MRRALTGAMAGAAGTTALNAATYTDMVLTGRGGSSAPKDVVDRFSERTDVPVPGTGEVRDNRASALGALLGMATGVGVGTLYGLARGTGRRPALPLAALLAGVAAMAGSDVPMAALKVSDPRSWKPADWLRDLLPHLTYGLVTAVVYEAAGGRAGRRRGGWRRRG